ncbi:dexamethasone-induced Ras-related protein 1-like [Ctenocephalides felis]|uniref:dexamethasone-induced Ras-related protein 1-like n=1 Tax=Ctenocephalides felis TaxID=7515 RepID=UPI000E6E407C|nr:dexamethasone-induced Ras-related protein 1-like [Ctenocephalides felis]
MECSSTLGRCAGWLCGKTGFASPGENNNAAVAGHNTSNGDRPASPVIEIMHGPGPSPGSSGSCDDSQPPLKNCYRLVMLGSARVGKTSLVSRFLGGKFDECYTPTIEDFHRKLYRIRGEVHQLDLLDTSGNHPFPAMRRLSFLTGKG